MSVFYLRGSISFRICKEIENLLKDRFETVKRLQSAFLGVQLIFRSTVDGILIRKR